MPKSSLHILIVTFLLLLTSSFCTDVQNSTQEPQVDVNHELVSSMKAIFASHPTIEEVVNDGKTQQYIKKPHEPPEKGVSIINPPRWPELLGCFCTCSWNCELLACCQQKNALFRIVKELAEIEEALKTLPPAQHIQAIVESKEGRPIAINANATLYMGENTIARQIVQKLDRESQIQMADSDDEERKEYLVMTVLLGREHKAFPRQKFFVIEPEYNYANASLVIGRDLLEEAGAVERLAEFGDFAITGLEIW